MAQEYKQKQSTKRETEEVDEQPLDISSDATEGLDDFLADIDGVLEENAQEFVEQYIQKGGQ
jgi:ubiquitin-like protein Pup